MRFPGVRDGAPRFPRLPRAIAARRRARSHRCSLSRGRCADPDRPTRRMNGIAEGAFKPLQALLLPPPSVAVSGLARTLRSFSSTAFQPLGSKLDRGPKRSGHIAPRRARPPAGPRRQAREALADTCDPRQPCVHSDACRRCVSSAPAFRVASSALVSAAFSRTASRCTHSPRLHFEPHRRIPSGIPSRSLRPDSRSR